MSYDGEKRRQYLTLHAEDCIQSSKTTLAPIPDEGTIIPEKAIIGT